MMRPLCVCFLVASIATATADEPSEAQKWDTDGTPAVGPASDVTIGSSLPDLPVLTPKQNAPPANTVTVGATADIHRMPAASKDSSSTESSNPGITTAGGLDALPGISEDRDFAEANQPTQAPFVDLASLESRPPLLRRESGIPSDAPAVTTPTEAPKADTLDELLSAAQRPTVSPAELDAIINSDSGDAARRSSVPLSHYLNNDDWADADSKSSGDGLKSVPRENRDDGERDVHPHSYQEDPQLTPEAIFQNKHLAPEVAEFLGHLAQRTRVSRKEYTRGLKAAGLAQSSVRHTGSGSDKDDTDDSDDIEDMKRAAAILPKKTALSHFFDKIDAKTKAAAWIPHDCAALAQNVSDAYAKMTGRSRATWATAGPASAASRAEVHTGMFFKHWKVGKEAARKLRLGVLSFLGTQDAGRVKLHIWTDLDKHSSELKEMLGPVAHHPELMDAINITTFDPKAEFAKVPPTLARERLTELYKKDTMPNLRADLLRSTILYNYGGLWMDADTMLMQDVSPLLGEDWAHLARGKSGIEGSILSASKPQSHFTSAYLISLVMREPPLDETEQQKSLLAEVFDNDPSHTLVHVLPPCFFDSDPMPETTAVLSSDASIGSPFFGKTVAEPYRSYFSLGIEDAGKSNSTGDASVLQDPANDEDKAPTAPVWAYHWRGNFGATWARGSMADVAERTFMKRLQMRVPH